MQKVKVGIIGTGNIGSDLLIKILRSKILEVGIFAGQNLNSEGIKMAKLLGVPVSYDSIDAIVKDPVCCEIVYDATSAQAHFKHAPILKSLGKFTVDMTPSRIGKMCIPTLNLDECLEEQNINMVTCGGQATAPIVKAIMEVHPETKYVEIIASISSKSAGVGTRNNIDEYTLTTAEGIKCFTKVPEAKAIIIVNPNEPPIIMHNTIYAIINRPNLKKISANLKTVVSKIKKFVPGYKLTLGPIEMNGKVTVMNEVTGLGDYLPIFAGNLDIINCAAIYVAEEYAKRKILNKSWK